MENAEGTVEAVDLTLGAEEGELKPGNPLPDVGIPQRSGEAISLPEAGVSVRLAGAPQESTASNVEGEFAFYPNVAEDTDYIVAPTPTGVETLTDLRSPAAPLTQRFEVSLPTDGTLEATAEGGAEVIGELGRVLLIPKPTATDAAGVTVPVELTVAGDSLELKVDPPEDAAYPILVDPSYISERWEWTINHSSLSKWDASTNDSPSYKALPYERWEATEYPGLDISSGFGQPGNYEAAANWVHSVPRYEKDLAEYKEAPTTYISSFYAEGVKFLPYGSTANYPVLVLGIVNPSYGWAVSQAHYGYQGEMNTWTNSFYIGNTLSGEAAHGVKQAAMNLTTYEYEPVAKWRDTYIALAQVYVADYDAPTFPRMVVPTQWMNGTRLPISYAVEDKGLGVKSVRVTGPGESAPHSGWGFALTCAGSAEDPCPRKVDSEAGGPELVYGPAVLPTGKDKLILTAKDPTGGVANTRTREIEVKIDHAAPEVSLSGPLTEQATLGDGLNEYKLKYAATDGNATVPQSGIVSTEVKVDGTLVEPKYAPGCATQNCAISKEWTLDASQFSYGKHTVEVTATDGVGLKTTQKLPIELLDVQQPPVAAYPFDEGSGTIAHDVSGDAHEGTLSAKGVTWAPGKYGTGLKFDGSEGCVSIPDSPALRLREEFTLESWVKPEGEVVHDPAIYKEAEGFPSYALGVGLSSTGRAEGKIGTQSKSTLSAISPASLKANVWSDIAVTYDGAALRLYVNGELVTTKAVEKTNSASLGPLQIGCDKIHGSYFHGRVDEVRIYDRALFENEIANDSGTAIQTPAAAPIAAYPFDENTGTTAHDSSGELHEGTFSAEGVSWAPGKYGSALKFDGAKGCVTIPDSEALRLGEEFSLESWVKPEGELSHLPILYKAGESFPAYDLGIGLTTAGRGEGQIGTQAKSHTDAATPAALEAGVWQHLAVTYDGANLRLYLNGVLAATKPVSEPNSAVPGTLSIGCGGAYHFRGRIDEVRIYNRAIGLGEVVADMAAPIQTPQQPPVAAYGFDEGQGTAAHDVTGNLHEGTLSAEGVSWAPGRYGDALKFDGVKGCVSIPDSTALQLREEFTLESWVRPEGELTHLPVLYKAGEGFPSYDLGIGLDTTGSGEGQIGTTAKGHVDVTTPTAMEANVWQYLAVTWDGAKLRIYLNGVLAATQAVSTPNAGGPGSLSIGCSPYSGYHFKGRIDEVRIYNRALSGGEVNIDRGPHDETWTVVSETPTGGIARATAKTTYPAEGDSLQRQNPILSIRTAAYGPVPEEASKSSSRPSMASSSPQEVEDRPYVYKECIYDPGAGGVMDHGGTLGGGETNKRAASKAAELAELRHCPVQEDGYTLRWGTEIVGKFSYIYGQEVWLNGPPKCIPEGDPTTEREEEEVERGEKKEAHGYNAKPELDGCFETALHGDKTTNGIDVIAHWIFDPGTDFLGPYNKKHEDACDFEDGHLSLRPPARSEVGFPISEVEHFYAFPSEYTPPGPPKCNWRHPRDFHQYH